MRFPGCEGERPVCFDAERAVHGIDIDVQLERALIAQTAERNTIRIKLAGDGDGALAFHRPNKRTRLAVEPHLAERDACATGRVGEIDRAILDAQPVHRQFIGLEADREIWRAQMARGVEPKADLRTGEMHLGGAPFAAHQWAERQFDAERASADRVAAIADDDVMQRELRRRQQAGLDRAGHAHADADEAARLRLEQRAMVAPVDQQRTHQRRHERQDECNRQSKQGGLQRQCPAPHPAHASASLCESKPFWRFMAANLCRSNRSELRSFPWKPNASPPSLPGLTRNP